MRLLIKDSLLCYVQSVVGIVSDEDIGEIVQLHWHWRDVKKALELLSQSTDNFFVRPLCEAGGFELATLYAKEIIQQFDRLSREYSLDDLPEFCTTSVCDLPPRSIDQVRPSILSETTLGRLLSRIEHIEGKLKSVESSQQAGVDPELLQHLVETSVSGALAPIRSEIVAIVNNLNQSDSVNVVKMPSVVPENNTAPRRATKQSEGPAGLCEQAKSLGSAAPDTAVDSNLTATMLQDGRRERMGNVNKSETRYSEETNIHTLPLHYGVTCQRFALCCCCCCTL